MYEYRQFNEECEGEEENDHFLNYTFFVKTLKNHNMLCPKARVMHPLVVFSSPFPFF